MRLIFCLILALHASLNCISQCYMMVRGTPRNLENDSLKYYFSLSQGDFLKEIYPYRILKKKLSNELVELQWIKRSDSSIFQSCQFSSKNLFANGRGYVEFFSDNYKITRYLNYLDGELHGVAKFTSIDTVDGRKSTEIIHYWHGKKHGRHCLMVNDAIIELCTYKNDKLEGEFEIYNYGYNEIGDSEKIVIEANNLHTVLQYKNDMVVDGEYIFYDHLAKPAGKRVYKNGKYKIVEFK